MCHGMRKPRKLKLRCYADRMIDINYYSAVFLVAKASDHIGDTELNKIRLDVMPNRWSKQLYLQGFYCETITLNNMLIYLNEWKLW